MSRALGDDIEQQVLHYLQQQGLQLVAQNYHCRQGEIDLIMREPTALMFVEVRYRKATTFGSAAESVNSRKQQRIITAARHFLMKHPRLQNLPCRFDVVACRPGNRNEDGNFSTGNVSIEWIKDAFQL